jgi:hypothetical protein
MKHEMEFKLIVSKVMYLYSFFSGKGQNTVYVRMLTLQNVLNLSKLQSIYTLYEIDSSLIRSIRPPHT